MVGQRIKAYLTENGIKQSFLSEKTDISAQTLAAILSGTRKLEVMEYYRICQALKVDMLTFLADGESEI
jgi:transcriptional regulator with XRE-family HTH domain